MPSAAWLRHYMAKYVNKWAQFTLTKESPWIESLARHDGFVPNQPITVKGIFVTVWKKPRRTPERTASHFGSYERVPKNEIAVWLQFRNITFHQGDKETSFFNSKFKKKSGFNFELNEINWQLLLPNGAGIANLAEFLAEPLRLSFQQ